MEDPNAGGPNDPGFRAPFVNDEEVEDELVLEPADVCKLKRRNTVRYDLIELKKINIQKQILTFQIHLRSLEGINIIYPNQEDCGKRINMIFNKRSHVNCLVYGMTQTGKTGCMTAYIARYVFDHEIHNENIYISFYTGTKDCKKLQVSFAKVNNNYLDFQNFFTSEECGKHDIYGGKMQNFTHNNLEGLLLTAVDVPSPL